MRSAMMLALAFHILAATIWVGGMFFAYMILRPAALGLEPPQRLPLWRRVFERFFPWVWASVAALLLSGFAMILWGFGGMAAAGAHVHVMLAIGILMMLIYSHLFFAPWRRFRGALDGGDIAAAGQQLGQIRRMVAINLALGLITVVIGATGRYW
jgi:uncharacterized membrane protein